MNAARTIAIITTLSLTLAAAEEDPRREKATLEMRAIAAALNMYKLNAGVYPTTDQGLGVLVEKPKVPPFPKRWVRLIKDRPKDPWGRDYQYKVEKGKFSLWSSGPDIEDKEDDVRYVAPEEEKQVSVD